MVAKEIARINITENIKTEKKSQMKAFILILHKKTRYSCEKTHFKGISDKAAMLKDRMRCSHNAFVCKNVLYQQLEASQAQQKYSTGPVPSQQQFIFCTLKCTPGLKGLSSHLL